MARTKEIDLLKKFPAIYDASRYDPLVNAFVSHYMMGNFGMNDMMESLIAYLLYSKYEAESLTNPMMKEQNSGRMKRLKESDAMKRFMKHSGIYNI